MSNKKNQNKLIIIKKWITTASILFSSIDVMSTVSNSSLFRKLLVVIKQTAYEEYSQVLQSFPPVVSDQIHSSQNLFKTIL